MRVTRLAPSPTGALHLGNARTFLINWLMARQGGWKIILRIEDLDGPRIKPAAAAQAIEDLAWLGIDFDEGPIYQSQRRSRYRASIDQLIASKHVYPCICTRREVDAAASAPHAEDGASVYPGTCRGRFASIEEAQQAVADRRGRSVDHRDHLAPYSDSPAVQAPPALAPALRFRVPDEIVRFDDHFAGPQSFDVAKQLGDFIVAKADGTPAYQMAVVVDDAAMHVTDIVRGDDLLDSTPRQILIYRALGLADRIPRYTHLPLVVGADGRRLAKRHGDTRVSYYRERGVSARQVLQLLAQWIGINDTSNVSSAHELIEQFRLDKIGSKPVVVGPVAFPPSPSGRGLG